MKIAWVVDRAKEEGGIAHCLYDYVSELPATLDVFFVAPEDASFPILEHSCYKVHKRLSSTRGGLAVVWGIANVVRFRRIAHELGCRTVICDHTGGLSLACCAKAMRVVDRVIYRNHGAEFLTTRKYNRIGRALKLVDVCLALNDEDKAIMKALGAQDVRVLPNPLPLHCDGRGSDNGINGLPSVGFVGAANHIKGIDRFMEVAELVAQRIRCTFVLTGAGCTKAADRLKARLRELGRPNLVIGRERVPRQEVFADLDVLCVCSPRESFSLVCVEAPFRNCLPISFRSAGPAWLRENGNDFDIVEQGDTQAMAKKTIAALQDPATRLSRCALLRSSFAQTLDRKRVLQAFAAYALGQSN